jgi:hypothetical protein
MPTDRQGMQHEWREEVGMRSVGGKIRRKESTRKTKT